MQCDLWPFRTCPSRTRVENCNLQSIQPPSWYIAGSEEYIQLLIALASMLWHHLTHNVLLGYSSFPQYLVTTKPTRCCVPVSRMTTMPAHTVIAVSKGAHEETRSSACYHHQAPSRQLYHESAPPVSGRNMCLGVQTFPNTLYDPTIQAGTCTVQTVDSPTHLRSDKAAERSLCT